MKRPRVWVVAVGTLIGLAGVGAAYSGYFITRTPGQSFAASFDRNLRNSQPVLGPIILSDRSLRDLALDRTQPAFEAGGWDAASAEFHRVIRSEVMVYADDSAMLACDNAWRDVRRSLIDRPELCRAYGPQMLDKPEFAAITRPARTACERAAVEGGRRRLTMSQPRTMPDERVVSLRRAAMLKPVALTPVEAEALNNVNAPLHCQALVRYEENLAALPAETRALMVRTEYRWEQRPEAARDAAPVPASLPPEFHCPAPGTQLTLSMQANGLPVQWSMRAQQGWDCTYASSVSGERQLWDTMGFNPLPLLWPLEAGKSVTRPDTNKAGQRVMRTVSVAGKGEYWLAGGRLDAITLDEEVKGADSHYVTSHYWSPTFGFVIGQRSRVIRGVLPSSVAPDWQLVAAEATKR